MAQILLWRALNKYLVMWGPDSWWILQIAGWISVEVFNWHLVCWLQEPPIHFAHLNMFCDSFFCVRRKVAVLTVTFEYLW